MRTLHDVQHEIDVLIKEEWHSHYWAPLSSLARLTEEVGELAREINAQYGEKPKKASEGPGNIATEMGDILFILASLANSIGVDLDTAFDELWAARQLEPDLDRLGADARTHLPPAWEIETDLTPLARALAAKEAGAVAFSRSGDPDLGEFAEAVVLYRGGEVPDEIPTG